tara:strand:+ start:547 stop:759 length:213 start_codon:yes stop_codon:yes gene_type:complete
MKYYKVEYKLGDLSTNHFRYYQAEDYESAQRLFADDSNKNIFVGGEACIISTEEYDPESDCCDVDVDCSC